MLGKLDGWSFCVDDALSRKEHELHVASLSTCQPDLRQQIFSHIAEDKVYIQIKDRCQQQNIERKYEGYRLEGDKLLTYKNRIYIPNVAGLRRIVMDEIHQAPHFAHPRYHKTIATTRK